MLKDMDASLVGISAAALIGPTLQNNCKRFNYLKSFFFIRIFVFN